MRIAILICTSVLALTGLSASDHDSGDSKTPMANLPRFARTESVLEFHDMRWVFAPSRCDNGLHVQWQRGNEKGEYNLTADGKISHVLDVDAVVNPFATGGFAMAVGFASQKDVDGPIEYRFAYVEAQKGELPSKTDWKVTETLITAPIDMPFQTVAISLDYGDSVTFTVQRHHRPRGAHPRPDGIETHVFVNDCAVSVPGIPYFTYYRFESQEPTERWEGKRQSPNNPSE